MLLCSPVLRVRRHNSSFSISDIFVKHLCDRHTTRNSGYSSSNTNCVMDLRNSNDVQFAAEPNAASVSSSARKNTDDNVLEDDKLQPIAVIGMSLKFPQSATTPESFWNMLLDGKSAMTEFPKNRLNIDAFYHPDANRRGSVRTDWDVKPVFSCLTTPKSFHSEEVIFSRKISRSSMLLSFQSPPQKLLVWTLNSGCYWSHRIMLWKTVSVTSNN